MQTEGVSELLFFIIHSQLLISARFSDVSMVNDNKMIIYNTTMTFGETNTTIKWAKVIIIMQKLHFKNNTRKKGIQSSWSFYKIGYCILENWKFWSLQLVLGLDILVSHKVFQVGNERGIVLAICDCFLLHIEICLSEHLWYWYCGLFHLYHYRENPHKRQSKSCKGIRSSE